MDEVKRCNDLCKELKIVLRELFLLNQVIKNYKELNGKDNVYGSLIADTKKNISNLSEERKKKTDELYKIHPSVKKFLDDEKNRLINQKKENEDNCKKMNAEVDDSIKKIESEIYICRENAFDLDL